MKRFEEYIDDKDVKRTTPNVNEIISIREDSLKRFENFWEIRQNKTMSKYVFENLYESLRELSETLALINSYKIYSHEIAISYLVHKNYLSREKAEIFDNLRKLRNKSKYYGKEISFERLNESLEEFKKLKDILSDLIEKEIEKLN